MSGAILPDFYDADRLEQVAITLFYGWGYNFYRAENQMRADDQLVRARVGAMLSEARDSIGAAESTWRRDKLPPPSRAAPRPDPAAVAGAQRLERLSAAIGALAGQVQAQPVPENDRMSQRRRTEAETLAHLLACDRRLVAQAELLRGMVDTQAGPWLLTHETHVEAGIAALGLTLRERRAVLAS